MFYFRINRLKIFDNKEKKFIGIIGKDVAQVKLISFVSTENVQFPNLTDYLLSNDEEQKKAILKAAIENVISSRILTEIENVKDNHIMTFGDTGYVLFQSEKIPANFDWNFIAYESDKNVRDTAAMVDNIINDDAFTKFSSNLGSLLKNIPNPAYLAYTEIAKFSINIIAKVAKNNKDDMIGILYMSLNRMEHYLHGERKKDDVPDLTNNMLIDYSIFGYE